MLQSIQEESFNPSKKYISMHPKKSQTSKKPILPISNPSRIVEIKGTMGSPHFRRNSNHPLFRQLSTTVEQNIQKGQVQQVSNDEKNEKQVIKKVKSWGFIPQPKIQSQNSQALIHDRFTELGSPRTIHQQHMNQNKNFYEYWKKKAQQYQEQNFKLEKENSSLKENLQILKHKLKMMEKKSQSRPQSNYQDTFISDSKMSEFYEREIAKLSHRLEIKENIIQKQDIKLKNLTQQIIDHEKMKNLLGKLDEKVSTGIYELSYEDFHRDKQLNASVSTKFPYQQTFSKSSSRPNLLSRDEDHDSQTFSMCRLKTKNSASIYNRSYLEESTPFE